jgi:hypothetical protein
MDCGRKIKSHNVRVQRSEIRGQEDTPPNYGQRDNGRRGSMEMPIFKPFLRAYPLSNPVGQRDSGQTMILTPHTRSNGPPDGRDRCKCLFSMGIMSG